jgi:hypothetical protein
MSELTIEQKLQMPFPPEDIEWRAQSSGMKNNKPWAMIMPYVTNRAIQDRLDEVFGVTGWENAYREVIQDTKISFLCGITIYKDNPPDASGYIDHYPITKWDGADETNFENFKGGLSNSMKRAGVQLGIGRYLYKLDTYFAELTEDRKGMSFSVVIKNGNDKKRYYFNAPKLPTFALPENFKYEAGKKSEPKDKHEEAIEDLGGKNLTQQASECNTDEELKAWWLGLSKEERQVAESVKNNRKEEIAEMNKSNDITFSQFYDDTSNGNQPYIYSFDELKAKKLVQLYEVCKAMDLMGYTKMKKPDVINLILKHQNK